MADVVGVRYKRAGRVYYFDPSGIELKVGDCIVVQTARGLELGRVVIAPGQVVIEIAVTGVAPLSPDLHGLPADVFTP